MTDKNIILALSPGQLRDDLLLYFGHHGIKAFVVTDNSSLMRLLKTTAIDGLLIQMMLENEDSIELILKVRDINNDIPILLIDRTGQSNHQLAGRLKVAAYFHNSFSSHDVFRKATSILDAKEKVYD